MIKINTWYYYNRNRTQFSYIIATNGYTSASYKYFTETNKKLTSGVNEFLILDSTLVVSGNILTYLYLT
jgi:hypothetical protein